jgi:hypothetical protein
MIQINLYQLAPKVEKFDINKNIPPKNKGAAKALLNGSDIIASQQIASTNHFLVLKKNDKNIWNVTVDQTSGEITNIEKTGGKLTPNVQSKNVFQKFDDSNYLVATSGNKNQSGIGVITVNPTTGETIG